MEDIQHTPLYPLRLLAYMKRKCRPQNLYKLAVLPPQAETQVAIYYHVVPKIK